MYNSRLSKATSSQSRSSSKNGATSSTADLEKLLQEIETVEQKKKEALEREDYGAALELKNRLRQLNSNLLRIEYGYFGDLFSTFLTQWANDLVKVISQQAFKDSNSTRKKVCRNMTFDTFLHFDLLGIFCVTLGCPLSKEIP